jgi:hypothetical protein
MWQSTPAAYMFSARPPRAVAWLVRTSKLETSTRRHRLGTGTFGALGTFEFGTVTCTSQISICQRDAPVGSRLIDVGCRPEQMPAHNTYSRTLMPMANVVKKCSSNVAFLLLISVVPYATDREISNDNFGKTMSLP